MKLNHNLALGLSLFLVTQSIPAHAADPLGKARGSDVKGELDVESVVRKSGVVTIRSTVKNNDKSSITIRNCENSYLLDPEKGIKYEVLEDEKGVPVGSASIYIPEGDERPLWCKFPAPPAEVKTIGYVHGGFEAIEDLPIADK